MSDERETHAQVFARIGDYMCVRTAACAEGRPHAPEDCPEIAEGEEEVSDE